jgi:hypothetical protein
LPALERTPLPWREPGRRQGDLRRLAAALILVPTLLLAGLMASRSLVTRAPDEPQVALPRAPDVPLAPVIAPVPPDAHMLPDAPRVSLPRTLEQPSLALPPDQHLPADGPRTAVIRRPEPPAIALAPPDQHWPPDAPRRLAPETPRAPIAIGLPPDSHWLPSPASPPPPDLPTLRPPIEAAPDTFAGRLVAGAMAQTSIETRYDPRYVRIAYPMGDVPASMGVCTDVVVRAYRALGVDLQELVHLSKLGSGDASMDHRRVVVLRRYLDKFAERLPVSPYPEDYKPGDIVTYDVPWGRTSKFHIAIVSDRLSPSLRPMVVHNRGYGARLEDALFHKRISGHYRYDGTLRPTAPAGGQLLTASARKGQQRAVSLGARSGG